MGSTVERADKIIVIKDGVAVEQGSHRELMMLPNSQYKKLVQRQLVPNDPANKREKQDDDITPEEDCFSIHSLKLNIGVPKSQSDRYIATSLTNQLGDISAHASSFQRVAEMNQGEDDMVVNYELDGTEEHY